MEVAYRVITKENLLLLVNSNIIHIQSFINGATYFSFFDGDDDNCFVIHLIKPRPRAPWDHCKEFLDTAIS